MKNAEINIRDPFIFCENRRYYMYGTRAKDFGMKTGGFDVYVGIDLENWSDPSPVFDSAKWGMNAASNWAPEMHAYKGRYYIFATFTQKNGVRGTWSLAADVPDGEFCPLSDKPLTPEDWWCLDGTLYVDRAGKPWLVFCHEHVQILNGTVCALPLKEDLSAPAGEPRLLFYGHNAYGVTPNAERRYITDGPFLFRGKNDALYLIWSTCLAGEYAQCLAVSDNGEINGNWIQLPPLFTEDGGHGMIFRDLSEDLRLVLHRPNVSLFEHPVFFRLEDTGTTLQISE